MSAAKRPKKHLKEISYRPSRSLLPVTEDKRGEIDRRSSTKDLHQELDYILPRIQEQVYTSHPDDMILSSLDRAENFPTWYTCARAQIRHSMDVFYALTRYVDDILGEQLTRVSLNFNTSGFVGLPPTNTVFQHVTTLVYKFDNDDTSAAHTNHLLLRMLAPKTFAMSRSSSCPNLRHVTFSGKSLTGNNALDMSKLWLGENSGFLQLHCPTWTPSLKTLSLVNVKLDGESVRKILQLPVRLRLENVAFSEISLDYFRIPFPRRLQLIEVSGLVVVSNGALGGYDRIWVLGSEVKAAATVQGYRRYVRDLRILGEIKYVLPKGLEGYILSGGASPLGMDNMWTTSKFLRLGDVTNE